MTWPPPPLPAPAALRLLRKSPTPRVTVVPPFGLGSWSDKGDADAALLLARGPDDDPPTLAAVLSELPLVTALGAGSLLVILGELEPSGALLGRLLRSKVRAPRSVRSSALLARGYKRIGAAVDPKSGADLVWGHA
jgi:hypothetical protein